jgi:hypothetical protein
VAMAVEESEGVHVSVKEQNTMTCSGGDKEVTHARVCALWHRRHVAGVVAASTARLQGGWRAKMTMTWLDGAATLKCSGGEATERQNSRDGAAASVSSGVEAERGSGTHQRREERRLTSGPGRNLKFQTKTKFCSKLDPFQTLASEIGKNPRKLMPTGFDVLDNFCYWDFLKLEMEFELKI